MRGVVAKFGRGITTQTGEIFQTFSVAGTAARQGFRVACPGALQRLGRHSWEIRLESAPERTSKDSPKMATFVFRPR